MSRLPSFRRIFTQDYPESAKELIDMLSISVNGGFEVLYEALNGKLTLSDNLDSTISDTQVEVDSTGKPKNKTSFKLKGTGRIQGLLILKAENLTNPNVYPTGGIFITYTETTTDIIINNVAGLPANNLFSLRIIALR